MHAKSHRKAPVAGALTDSAWEMPALTRSVAAWRLGLTSSPVYAVASGWINRAFRSGGGAISHCISPRGGGPCGSHSGRTEGQYRLPSLLQTHPEDSRSALTRGRVSPAAISASKAPHARPLPSFLLVWVGEESSRSFLCTSLVLVPAFALSLVHPTNVNARASLPSFGSARGRPSSQDLTV